MLNTFWQKIGEGLAGEWNARTLTPALAFWGGALLAYNHRYSWKRFQDFLKDVDPVIGVALLVGLLFLLAASTGLVQWLTLPVLRLIEGYWPRPFRGLRRWRTGQVKDSFLEKENEFGVLADKYEAGTATSLESERYALLELELDQYPQDTLLLLPTKVGNFLRSAEEYPWRCYGLEITTTWPRIWLTMPESAQKELAEARQALDWVAQLFIWGVAFIVWTIWAWWPLPAGLVVAVAAYLRLPAVADIYGQMLRAAYDLYRFDLYESLRWPPPADPETEKQFGLALTNYLKRNIPPNKLPPNNSKLFFKHKEKDE